MSCTIEKRLRQNAFEKARLWPWLAHRSYRTAAHSDQQLDLQQQQQLLPAVSQPTSRSHHANPESRLDPDRNRYIDRIARYLPKDPEDKKRWSVTKKPRSRDVDPERSGAFSLDRGQDQLFLDWRTALTILKKHYRPQVSETAADHDGLVRRVGPRTAKHGLEQITRLPKKPVVWTEAVLVAYIQELVNFRPPRPILSEVLPTEWKDQQLLSTFDVADIIEQTLNDPNLRKYTSVKACNVALQFFYDRGMMTRARRLYVRMEYLYLEISATTWNIILRACATLKDLYNFTFLLGEMILRGLKPNEHTWVTFIMVLESRAHKKVVANIMRRGGMMETPGVARQVATQMISNELLKYQNTDAYAVPFFTHMSQLYGVDWLSTSTGNTLISTILQIDQGQPIKAVIHILRLLYEMKQSAFQADEVTMNMLFKPCMQIEQDDLPIKILSIFEQHWNCTPGILAHQTLFRLAWRHQRLNMLRVLWISACLNGFVTFHMQDHIMQSLLKNDDAFNRPHPPASPDSFDCLVGRFLVGTDYSSEVLGTTHHKPERKERTADKYVLAVKSMLATAGQGRLRGGLIYQLQRALEIDKRWASEGFWSDPQQQGRLFNSSLQVDIRKIVWEIVPGVGNERGLTDAQRDRRLAVKRRLKLQLKGSKSPLTGLVTIEDQSSEQDA
ncbi:MAG: hypothetical protein Q9164_001212 [Protoblastenia rupestris]